MMQRTLALEPKGHNASSWQRTDQLCCMHMYSKAMDPKSFFELALY
jgi:hypothetical protein